MKTLDTTDGTHPDETAPPAEGGAGSVERLLTIMARLRDPGGGCPWDIEQTFASVAPYTIEEAYEVADAIAQGDLEGLRDELGDLLFQVVFHSRMAEEVGRFKFEDVARGACEKMERRHPHVFGKARVASAREQTVAWEEHKAEERGARGARGTPSELDGVSLALPALVRAQKLQRRAARVGFDWPDVEGALAKLDEELEELRSARRAGEPPERVEAELGDLLFTCVNVGRHLGVDAEGALRRANGRFEARFRRLEALLDRRPGQASPAELDAAWEQAKAEEGGERSGAPGAHSSSSSKESGGGAPS